ncbi:MAG: histidine phosphatase family protein [Patescibacteria group bacterium UBA2163]
MELFIARHGEDTDTAMGRFNGTHDAALTDRGKEQARLLAQQLHQSPLRFESIFSSPLQRALDTAHILHEVGGQPLPRIEENLHERNIGVLTGKTVPQAEQIYQGETYSVNDRVFFLHPPEGETFDELFERAHTLLQSLKEVSGAGKVCLVTHRGIATMLYASWYGVSWKEALGAFVINPAELFYFTKDASPEKLF